MNDYSKEIKEEQQKIDLLIEKSRRDDIFLEARDKLRELHRTDDSLLELTLHFKSKAFGTISVPVTID